MMKLNTNINIESRYIEDTDSNQVTFSITDLNMTLSEFLTTLELTKNTVIDLIKSTITDEELEDTNKFLRETTIEELYNRQQ
jgi:lipoate-protein ligase A